MGLKELYAHLETTEEGKKALEAAKAELDLMKDSAAKVRKMESENKALAAASAEFAKLQEKLRAAGIDPDDPAPPAPPPAAGASAPAPASAQSNDADRRIEKMQKQYNVMSEKLEAERKAREMMEQRVRVEKLRNDFGSVLREQMGKFGAVLSDSLIDKGLVKVDESGAVIYEVGDKIYTMEAAVELLKSEHKEYLVAKQTGSNMPPPASSGKAAPPANSLGMSDEDIKKTTPTQWFGKAAQAAAG